MWRTAVDYTKKLVMEFMIVTKISEEMMAMVLRSADSSACSGIARMVMIGAIDDIGAIKMIMMIMRTSASKGTNSQTKVAMMAPQM